MKTSGAIRKCLVVLLTVAMVSSFAACSATSSPTAAPTAAPTSAPASTTSEATTATPASTEASTAAPDSKYVTPKDQKYSTSVTVTSVRVANDLPFAAGEDWENNLWTKAALNEYGIIVKYKWVVAQDQYNDKLALTLSSGDIPDFFTIYDTAEYELALKSGILGDITDAYNNYASEATKERLAIDPNAVKAGTYNGKMYALAQSSGATENVNFLWIRSDWLKKLGLNAPKTVDDLVNIATAFTTKDPDGNGQNDTYGIGLNVSVGADTFYNCYKAYKGMWLPDSSGNLAYSSIQPEMKQALAKLQEMYKAGLLNKEYFSQSYDDFVKDANSGKVGMLFDNYILPLRFADGWDANHEMDFEPYALPSTSADTYPAKGSAGNGFAYYIVARNGWDHPEAMIKLVNLFVDKQSNDANYLHDSAGNQIYLCTPVNLSTPSNNLINSRYIAKAIANNGDTTGMPSQAVQALENVMAYRNGDVTKDKRWYWKIFDPTGSLNFLDQNYIQTGYYVQNQWYQAPTATMVTKQASLTDLENQTFMKIIMGSPISDFDTFVENWKKMGGDAITSEVNAVYQANK